MFVTLLKVVFIAGIKCHLFRFARWLLIFVKKLIRELRVFDRRSVRIVADQLNIIRNDYHNDFTNRHLTVLIRPTIAKELIINPRWNVLFDVHPNWRMIDFKMSQWNEGSLSFYCSIIMLTLNIMTIQIVDNPDEDNQKNRQTSFHWWWRN